MRRYPFVRKYSCGPEAGDGSLSGLGLLAGRARGASARGHEKVPGSMSWRAGFAPPPLGCAAPSSFVTSHPSSVRSSSALKGRNRPAQGNALGIGVGETSVSPNGAAQAQSHTYGKRCGEGLETATVASARPRNYAALSGLGRRSESSTQGVALGFPMLPLRGAGRRGAGASFVGARRAIEALPRRAIPQLCQRRLAAPPPEIR